MSLQSDLPSPEPARVAERQREAVAAGPRAAAEAAARATPPMVLAVLGVIVGVAGAIVLLWLLVA